MKDYIIYKEKVRLEEGYRETVYRDHLGVRTFGIGHNIDANPIPPYIIEIIINTSIEEGVEELFKFDLTRVIHQLDMFVKWWRKKPLNVRVVLVDMVFNMGIHGVLKFRTTLRYMRVNDFKGAGLNLMASIYARQVPNRAKRNKELLDSLG